MIIYFIIFLVIFLPLLAAFFIAYQVYRAMQKSETALPWLWTIIVFLVAAFLLYCLTGMVLGALGAFNR